MPSQEQLRAPLVQNMSSSMASGSSLAGSMNSEHLSQLSLYTPEEVVTNVLAPIGLGIHGENFAKHKISGRVLRLLTEQDLRELLPLIGERALFAEFLENIQASKKWAQLTEVLLEWTAASNNWGLCAPCCRGCVGNPRYKLTSAHIEVTQSSCFGAAVRESVDLGDVEDVTEEAQCCCLECIDCSLCGCGMHTIVVRLRDQILGPEATESSDGKRSNIITVVRKEEAHEIYTTLRNAWEMHHQQIRT